MAGKAKTLEIEVPCAKGTHCAVIRVYSDARIEKVENPCESALSAFAKWLPCEEFLRDLTEYWAWLCTWQKGRQEKNPKELLEYLAGRSEGSPTRNGELWIPALRKVCSTLGEIGDARAVPALIEAVRDRDVRRGAVEALVRIGAVAVPALIEALRDRGVYVRREAARALGEIGDACAVPALIEALRDWDIYVRRGAAWALGEIGDASAVPALVKALRDWDVYVRRGAVEALGKIGGAAVPALIEALRDRDVYVRRGAVEALGKIGSAAVPALIEALRDRNEDVRCGAARALGEIGDARAVPALTEALRDERDRYVRDAIAQALGELGYRL